MSSSQVVTVKIPVTEDTDMYLKGLTLITFGGVEEMDGGVEAAPNEI